MEVSLVLSSGGAHFPHIACTAGYVTPYSEKEDYRYNQNHNPPLPHRGVTNVFGGSPLIILPVRGLLPVTRH